MTAQQHRVCLLLGSNIEPEKNLPRALELLRQAATVLQTSSVWQTPSIGNQGPDFLNMALLMLTPFGSGELKEKLLRPLEARLGRVRTADKNAPRTIDLDIIVFDGEILDRELFSYAHRAVPVAEIIPQLHSPQGDSLDKVAAELANTTPIHLRSGVLI